MGGEVCAQTQIARYFSLPYTYNVAIVVIVLLLLASTVGAQTDTPVLLSGVYQAEDPAITLPDDAQQVARPGAILGDAVQTTEATFTTMGTEVRLRWRGGGEVIEVERDGVNTLAGGQCTRPLYEDEWHVSVLCSSLTSQQHTFRIVPVVEDEPLYLDTILVLDRTYENLYPLAAALVIGVGLLGWVVVRALWERKR